jgi:hypothetical protein
LAEEVHAALVVTVDGVLSLVNRVGVEAFARGFLFVGLSLGLNQVTLRALLLGARAYRPRCVCE